jgi:Trypsin-like peptidase domain
MHSSVKLNVSAAACVLGAWLAPAFAADPPVADSLGLFAKATPSVVLLTAYDVNGTPLRQGSGFFVDDAGTVVTADEIVGDAAIVEVRTADGGTHSALAMLAEDSAADLALLRVEASGITALPLAEDDTPATGTPVHVVGNGVQLKSALYSGVVSGVRTRPDGGPAQLEISNQLYPVTSGAPVLGNDGRVLGVAIFVADPAAQVNLAVSVASLRALLAHNRDGAPVRPLAALSEAMRTRVQQAAALRTQLLSECAPNDIVNIDRVLREILAVAAPITHDGDHLAAYKLYEGASYKLIYLLGDRCPSASKALSEAIAEAARDAAVADKAAVVRYAFDSLLGTPAEGKGDERL